MKLVLGLHDDPPKCYGAIYHFRLILITDGNSKAPALGENYKINIYEWDAIEWSESIGSYKGKF